MRLADVTKVVGVVLLVVAAFAAPTAFAWPDPACVQACADQYELDKAACQSAYDQAVTAANQHELDCLNLPPADQPACLRSVDSERRAAKNANKKCLNLAKKDYNACVRACPAESPVTP